uniref:TATA-box binding protein associated factor 4 n=1 Tax=Callorhinchus milii TaxID=7868 RepID=A0A4W3JDT1_CALMI
KVVSDLVGSLETQLAASGHSAAEEPGSRAQALNNHVENTGGSGGGGGSGSGVSNNVQLPPTAENKMGLTPASGSIAQGKSVVISAMAPPVSNHVKTVTSNVQTLNGNNGMLINSHNAGSATTFTCSAAATTTLPAVTVVNNGPGSVVKGTMNAALPAASLPASSSAYTVIQTSFVSTQNVPTSTVVSSPAAGPTVTLVRPPAHSAATLNVSLSAGGQVIKSDSQQPKTIIQTPQQTIGTGITMVIGQPMQSGIQNVAPNPGGISTQPAGTPTGMAKGTICTVAQTLARTAAVNTGPRTTITPQIIAPRLPQPPQHQPNIQNIQIPPGMVLVRSDSGQLMLIPQQALQQMQSQAQSQGALTSRSATPGSAPPVQISTVQAPGTQIIARQVTPTIIKPVSQPQTTVQQTTTLQRPPTVQVCLLQLYFTETMENVKKCKNFLSTLIKLASSGKQSTETAANVKELVQNLLDGKIEAEDFTSRLYRELNSSPQPYLVPFLKRSLPALRQLTQDSQAFIQQSQLQQPSTQTTTALTAVVLGNTVPQRSTVRTATATVTSTLQHPVLSLAQTGQAGQSKAGQPTQLVVQPQSQQGTLVRPQVTLTSAPMVTLRQPQNRIMLTAPPQVQLKQFHQTVPVMKQTVVSGNKAGVTYSVQTSVVQKNKLKEAAGGSFRDDDDINDVASMAGVNLSEESARILATNSELVGTLTRSCKDEAFLFNAPLHRRILEIGKKKKHGITEIHPDVVSFVSHATQQRLQTLVEKISEVAQQRNISYKEDDRYEQLSDVRSQLKFFEQLDQMEKQRKDEQEREILMRAAKSRSRQEDPEQLRLKQKAKEMQQQELAQMRQREANLTALAAIGPRKKRKVDSPGPGTGSGTEGTSPGGTPGGSGVGTTRQFARQRITRVNLRDLIFCLENERETSHSLTLYRAFLK